MTKKDILDYLPNDCKNYCYVEVIARGKFYKLHYDKFTKELHSAIFYGFLKPYVRFSDTVKDKFVYISSKKIEPRLIDSVSKK